MGLIGAIRDSVQDRVQALLNSQESKRIGVFGMPNAGKTTLQKRIAHDFGMDALGRASGIPHETTSTNELDDLEIKTDEEELKMDLVDTPGIARTVDQNEFREFDIGKAAAAQREEEAAEAVGKAVEELNSVDGVVFMIDAAADPAQRENKEVLELIEERNMPVILVANKIDRGDCNVDRVRRTFPRHQILKLSATEGTYIKELYKQMAKTFGEKK